MSEGATAKALALLDRACAGHAIGSCLTLAKTLASRSPERAFRAASSVCDSLKGPACDQAIAVAITTGHADQGFAWSLRGRRRHRAQLCEGARDVEHGLRVGQALRLGLGVREDRDEAAVATAARLSVAASRTTEGAA